jgi:hypothetical protein
MRELVESEREHQSRDCVVLWNGTAGVVIIDGIRFIHCRSLDCMRGFRAVNVVMLADANKLPEYELMKEYAKTIEAGKQHEHP